MIEVALLALVAKYLDQIVIPYMVTGSVACSVYGEQRTTHDADVVIDPAPGQLDAFVNLFEEEIYISREAAEQAYRMRSMFNIINFSTGEKVDLIVRKSRPFSIVEFGRRSDSIIEGKSFPVASVEDVILSKLEWNAISPSDRQIRDIEGIFAVNKSPIDRVYLRHWAEQLGVSKSLEEILGRVETPPAS